MTERRTFGGAAATACVALGVALGLLITDGGVAARAQDASSPTQNPLAGSEVFEAKGCMACHAVNGLGGNVGPDLGRIPRRRSFYELAASLWNHVPKMETWMAEYGIDQRTMDAREAADLISFLFTVDYFDAPGDVAVGKRLFTEKKCIVCHQAGDYGGAVGPDLDRLGQFGSPILVAATMWNHGPAMAERMAEAGVQRPTFEGAELNDLIAYLQSIAPEPIEGPVYVLPGRAEAGRVIFVEKRCQECHSVQGVGGRVGPSLAGEGRRWGLTEFAAAMWNKAPAMTSVMKEREIAVPQLGGTEMADLVAYLYSIEYFAEFGDPELGERRLQENGCLDCHALNGRYGESAGDLARVGGLESPAALAAVLWNHAPVMGESATKLRKEWPELTPEELADLTAFLQELTGGS